MTYKEAHRAFMLTDKWRDMVERIKARVRYKTGGCLRCEVCGSKNGPFDVHHWTYARFGGNELLSDLSLLCRDCHEQVTEARHRCSWAELAKLWANYRPGSLPPQVPPEKALTWEELEKLWLDL